MTEPLLAQGEKKQKTTWHEYSAATKPLLWAHCNLARVLGLSSRGLSTWDFALEPVAIPLDSSKQWQWCCCGTGGLSRAPGAWHLQAQQVSASAPSTVPALAGQRAGPADSWGWNACPARTAWGAALTWAGKRGPWGTRQQTRTMRGLARTWGQSQATAVHGGKMRRCGQEVTQGLEMRRNKQGHRLPREVIQSPTLKVFKTSLGKVLNDHFKAHNWLLSTGGWTRDLPRPFPTQITNPSWVTHRKPFYFSETDFWNNIHAKAFQNLAFGILFVIKLLYSLNIVQYSICPLLHERTYLYPEVGGFSFQKTQQGCPVNIWFYCTVHSRLFSTCMLLEGRANTAMDICRQ